jgi:hypothetical protein
MTDAPVRYRRMNPVLVDGFGLSREILENTVLRVAQRLHLS